MSNLAFDPVRFKEQERAGFNLVANRYEAAMTSMGSVNLRIIELADLATGHHVLDVATGPGILAKLAGQVVGSMGTVLGVDIAEDALTVARKEILSNVSFEMQDAEAMTLDAASFERVLCGLGLMHFPDPQKTLAEMWRVLKPNGRLVVGVWGEETSVPFIAAALSALSRVFPPPKVVRPSMFRFGQPQILQNLLETTGFRAVQTEIVTMQLRVASAADYWKRFLDVAGITTVALAKQPPETLDKLQLEVESDLAPYHQTDGSYLLSNYIVLATGLK